MTPTQWFTAPNLATQDVVPSVPWDFLPAPESVAQMRGLEKARRRALMLSATTNWQVYSAVRGRNRGAVVSNDNPAAGVRGFVADYDAVQDIDAIAALVAQRPFDLRPQHLEFTLGGKCRLLWVFPEEVPVVDSAHAGRLLEAFARVVGVASTLAGYDLASAKPAQRWTNGGSWASLTEVPPAVPASLLSGIVLEVGSKLYTDSRPEIPLEQIAAEVQARFPGRWVGEFSLNALGVRFWDEKADSPQGCQVKPDGMLCFTGPAPFLRWADIFGGDWVRTQTAKSDAALVEGLYYDGMIYWLEHGQRWDGLNDSAIQIELKFRGASARLRKGETITDVERLIRFIQRERRVLAAAPLINYRPGLVQVGEDSYLNTSSLKILEPAPGPASIERFPWTWSFISRLFARSEEDTLGDPFDYWLAWAQRTYVSALTFTPAMGQAHFLCGPVHNGKTLLVNRVLGALLGGRHRNPYNYFIGRTDFTDELFTSFLWAIHDEEAPQNEGERRKFLQKTKSAVVNFDHTFHPKFRNKFTVPWVGRCVITLNDDATAAAGLIEVDSSTQDKVSFFRTKQVFDAWPSLQETEATILEEAPYFARWLLDWTPPSHVLAPTRMGVKSYHDSQLLMLSRQQQASFGLVELLRVWIESTDVAEKAESAVGTPLMFRSLIFAAPHLQWMARDWTGVRFGRAMFDLSRMKDSGIELLEPKKGGPREYRVHFDAVHPDRKSPAAA